MVSGVTDSSVTTCYKLFNLEVLEMEPLRFSKCRLKLTFTKPLQIGFKLLFVKFN